MNLTVLWIVLAIIVACLIGVAIRRRRKREQWQIEDERVMLAESNEQYGGDVPS